MSVFVTLINLLGLTITNSSNISSNIQQKSLSSSLTAFSIYEDESSITNDNVSQPTSMLPDNYYSYNNIEINFHGKCETITGIYDIDYLYFTILHPSKVDISLTSQNDLEFCLNELTYANNNPVKDNYLNMVYSSVNNEEVKFSNDLETGTYIIYLRGLIPNEDFNYLINLKIQETYRDNNVSLNSLCYNKNLPGAIWINDFIPTSELDFFNMGNNLQINFNYRDFLLEDMYKLTNGNKIHLASYYLWDPSLKVAFAQIIKQITDTLESKLSSQNEIESAILNGIEIIEQSLSSSALIIDIVCTISGIHIPIVISLITTIAIPLLSSILTSFVQFIFGGLTNNKDKFLEYLNELINELDAKLYNSDNGNNYGDFRVDVELPISVLEIPIFYKITRKGSTYIYDLEFDTTFNTNENPPRKILFDQMLYIEQYGADPLSYGYFYGLENVETKIKKNKEKEINSIPNVIRTPKNLNIGANFTCKFRTGDYRWYKYTALESGTYHFTATSELKNNVLIEIFSKVALGYSDDGLLQRAKGNYSDLINEIYGTYAYQHLDVNETIYLRIRTENFEKLSGELSINVYDEQPYYSSHYHVYSGEYIYIDGKYHKKMCVEGDWDVMGHVVSSVGNQKGKRCLLCGGIADIGFEIIGPTADSYILNDVYILSERDTTILKSMIKNIP